MWAVGCLFRGPVVFGIALTVIGVDVVGVVRIAVIPVDALLLTSVGVYPPIRHTLLLLEVGRRETRVVVSLLSSHLSALVVVVDTNVAEGLHGGVGGTLDEIRTMLGTLR